jgi:fibro-slime domain-containing protein
MKNAFQLSRRRAAAAGWLLLATPAGCAGVRAGATTSADAGSPDDAIARSDGGGMAREVAMRPDLGTGVRVDTGTPSDASCAHELKVVVRDFRGYAGAAGPRHPDFEGDFTSYLGIVQEQLGPDQKPVYAPAGATAATTGKANFDQWYRDVDGVNMRFDDVVLPLTNDPNQPGTFVYDNQMFFPIDGRGWMDNAFASHNYHFTTEVHVRFSYHGGESFTFRGDDDVFVFINGHLAIDLGGVHPAQMGSVDLDAQAANLGIARNNSYNLDIFQAERHTTESTFRLETTLDCVTSYVIP